MQLGQEIVDNYRSGTPDRVTRADDLVAVDEIKIFNGIAAEVDALVTAVRSARSTTGSPRSPTATVT